MLKRIKVAFKNSSKLFLISGVILVVAGVFILLTNGNYHRKKLTVNKEEIIQLASNIKDNYTMQIEENKDEVITKYIYYIEPNIKLFETENESKGYALYKEKQYVMNENRKLSKLKTNYDKFDNIFYNYNIIKEILNKCEYEYVNASTADCKIKVSDYLNILNNITNSSYDSISKEDIDLSVQYSNSINTINIDYTNANKLIGDGKRLAYNIKISNLGKNDFSEIIDHYKSVLKD